MFTPPPQSLIPRQTAHVTSAHDAGRTDLPDAFFTRACHYPYYLIGCPLWGSGGAQSFPRAAINRRRDDMFAIESAFVTSIVNRERDRNTETTENTPPSRQSCHRDSSQTCVQQDTMAKRISELSMWKSRSVVQDRSGYVSCRCLYAESIGIDPCRSPRPT